MVVLVAVSIELEFGNDELPNDRIELGPVVVATVEMVDTLQYAVFVLFVDDDDDDDDKLALANISKCVRQ